MLVVVNNESKELADQSVLFDLLTSLSLSEGKGMAVAINNKVIPKTQWQEKMLCENDHVTIIKATQGG